MMSPAWPKRIECGHGWVTFRNGHKTGLSKGKIRSSFGRARKPARMFRVGLYARVSTNDQQTLPIQSRALREYAVRRGWTITVHIRGIQQFAQGHFDFARD
jgi:predicted site-specific integrase-resolvase